MKNIVLVVCLLVVLPFINTFAEDLTSGQSKEDRRFEAQGRIELPEIPVIFDDGIIKLEYSYSQNIKDPLDFSEQSIILSVETRLMTAAADREGYYDEECINHTNNWAKCIKLEENKENYALVLPVEMKIRAFYDKGSEDSLAELNSLKVGALRGVFNAVGITAQVASYSFERLMSGFGDVHSFELIGLTTNHTVDLTGNKGIELVVKGFVNFGMSFFMPDTIALKKIMRDNGYEDNKGFYSEGTMFTPRASIGLRFSKKVLVELFGGYEEFRTEGDGEIHSIEPIIQNDDQTVYNQLELKSFLNHKFFGTSVRFIVNDDIHIVSRYQKDYFHYWVNFSEKHNSTNNIQNINRTSTIDSGYLGLEYRW